MKRTFTVALAMIAASLAANILHAQDNMVDPVQDSMDTVMLDCCCCNSSAWFVGVEATFMKFFDSGGVEDFAGDDGEFNYEISPRITAGWVDCDGFGTRIRFWEYDHTTLSVDNDIIAVDTYTIDLEVFQNIELGSCTSVEVSGGLRYNDFSMDREAGGVDRFRGIGGMIGAEVNRDLNCNWSAYGRTRQVILADDFFASELFGGGGDENDGIRDVTEIALGLEYCGGGITFHAGYEWHLWSNYTRGTFANVDLETRDIGFSGFVIGGELTY